MKRAIVTFLVFAAAGTTIAVAQDGTGRGPPRAPIIVMPQPLPAPTRTSTTVPVPRLSELDQR
jgi:hypothetical protein